MIILISVAAIAASAWVIVASLLLAESFQLTRHSAPLPRRKRSITRLRLLNSMALVCLTLILVAGGLSFQRYDLFPLLEGLPLKGLLAAFGLAYLMLVMVTLLIPDLPGRALLRRVENLGATLIAITLALMGMVAIRLLPWEFTYGTAVGALCLSMLFAFFVASRVYLRGALVVAGHIVSHGSHPNREATLKRLMRRYRPFVFASIIGLAIGMLLLQ